MAIHIPQDGISIPGCPRPQLDDACQPSLPEVFAQARHFGPPPLILRGPRQLNAATPFEKYFDETPANEFSRYEPRKRWPRHSKCAAPQVPLEESPGTKLKLVICYYQGDKKLPIIRLKKVA